MNINSIQSIPTQQNYNRTNHANQKVAFGSIIELSESAKGLITTAEAANKIQKLIKKAVNDGKDYVIKISTEIFEHREVKLKRRGDLKMYEIHALKDNPGERVLIADISSQKRSYGNVAPGRFSELFCGLPGQIKSIYNQTLTKMAPIDDKKAAHKILERN